MKDILSLSILLSACIASNIPEVEARLWLQPEHHDWQQHIWDTTVDLTRVQKLPKGALPAGMKPFEDVLTMFKAAGYKYPEEVLSKLHQAPESVSRRLLDAVLGLPCLSPSEIPSDTLEHRTHPAVRLARGLCGLRDKLQSLRTAQDCGPEIKQLTTAFGKILENTGRLSGDAPNLRQTVGLLGQFFRDHTGSSIQPNLVDVTKLLTLKHNGVEGIDVFIRSLKTDDINAVKAAIKEFYPAVHRYVSGPFISPKHIADRVSALYRAITANKAIVPSLAKRESKLEALAKQIDEFNGQFNVIKSRFVLAGEWSFRGFMKAFDLMLGTISAGLDRHEQSVAFTEPIIEVPVVEVAKSVAGAAGVPPPPNQTGVGAAAGPITQAGPGAAGAPGVPNAQTETGVVDRPPPIPATGQTGTGAGAQPGAGGHHLAGGPAPANQQNTVGGPAPESQQHSAGGPAPAAAGFTEDKAARSAVKQAELAAMRAQLTKLQASLAKLKTTADALAVNMDAFANRKAK